MWSIHSLTQGWFAKEQSLNQLSFIGCHTVTLRQIYLNSFNVKPKQVGVGCKNKLKYLHDCCRVGVPPPALGSLCCTEAALSIDPTSTSCHVTSQTNTTRHSHLLPELLYLKLDIALLPTLLCLPCLHPLRCYQDHIKSAGVTLVLAVGIKGVIANRQLDSHWPDWK